MGMDKGLLEIDGVPLIVRTARLLDGVDRMVSAATVVGRAGNIPADWIAGDRRRLAGLRAFGRNCDGAARVG